MLKRSYKLYSIRRAINESWRRCSWIFLTGQPGLNTTKCAFEHHFRGVKYSLHCFCQIIPQPRCIKVIQNNLAKNKYRDPLDVYTDLGLVFLNALYYNEEGSQIANDATTLKVCLAAFQSSLLSRMSTSVCPRGRVETAIIPPNATLLSAPFFSSEDPCCIHWLQTNTQTHSAKVPEQARPHPATTGRCTHSRSIDPSRARS